MPDYMLKDERIRYVFVVCNQIREFSNSLFGQVQAIEEISMNAGIRASQTSQSTRVFNEIARNITRIAAQMKSAITEIRVETQRISNWGLDAFKKNHLSRKMHQALQMGCRANDPVVRSGIAQIDVAILKNLELIEERVLHLRLLHEKLEQINRRIWTVVLNLKIESRAVDSLEEDFFLSIAESLSEMAEQITGRLKQLDQLSKMLTLSNEPSADKESVHAA